MPRYTIPTTVSLPASAKAAGRRRVVMVAIPDGEMLGFMGPLGVLREANYLLDYCGRSDVGYDIEIVTTVPGAVFTEGGLNIVVDKDCHSIRGSIDTLIFQSIDEQELCLRDCRFLSWVSRKAATVRRVATICGGTYILAEAGVLDGRRATTHWAACDDFRRRYPEVDLDADPLFTKDGNIYTTAGVTAGIDLLLALVEEDFGAELARNVAQSLVLFLRRSANQSQFRPHARPEPCRSTRIQAIASHISENLADDLSVGALAARTGMSPRNFSRVFTEAMGTPPGKFVEQSRVALARKCLEETDMTVESIATRCGYSTSDGMRLAFNRQLGVGPRGYRHRFSSARLE